MLDQMLEVLRDKGGFRPGSDAGKSVTAFGGARVFDALAPVIFPSAGLAAGAGDTTTASLPHSSATSNA